LTPWYDEYDDEIKKQQQLKAERHALEQDLRAAITALEEIGDHPRVIRLREKLIGLQLQKQ
jgi:hypothetical protein